MCNLYSNTTTQQLMRQLFSGLTDRAGNLAPGQVYPDQLGAIVRHGDDGLELAKARWGMPSPPGVLKTQRDPGVTNVRNLCPHIGGGGSGRSIAAWFRSRPSRNR